MCAYAHAFQITSGAFALKRTNRVIHMQIFVSLVNVIYSILEN